MVNTIPGRCCDVSRTTAETDISISLCVDGTGETTIASGVPFLDHMLTLFAVHGFFDLRVQASGDTEIDDHHSVEDIGICLGQAIRRALGDKIGIRRYGMSILPMDESLVRVAVDISNRPFLHYAVPVPDQKVGTFDTSLAKEFMRALAQHGGLTLHIDLLHGDNTHHIIEAVFKALGRAINEATATIAGLNRVLSSKGAI